jgi:dedicated sortase system histidine kinase
MTLNKQLLAVSLIMLCLPWAGCQYLQEMHGIMRTSQAQALMASSKAVAAVFSQQAALLYPHGERYPTANGNTQLPASLYFSPLQTSLWIDGYDEGWESLPETRYPHPVDNQQRTSVRSGKFNQQLFLWFEVTDQQVVYNNPGTSLLEDGDRLVLMTSSATYSFTTSAPGNVSARHLSGAKTGQREPAITAYWQETEQGYNLEIQLPMALAGARLGFYIVDQDTDHISRYGQLTLSDRRPPLFIYQPPDLQQQLAIFQQPGQRLRIIDSYGWTLSASGSLQQPRAPAGNWVIRRFYRLLLNNNPEDYPAYTEQSRQRDEISKAFDGFSSSVWYRDSLRPNQLLLASATPIIEQDTIVAVLLAEQSSEQLAALSDGAFSRLLLLSIGAISLVAVALLGYASWLSWRIRRLSHAASKVVSADGKLVGQFPDSRAADEVGELTRSYGQLLQRIGEYTEYLQTLSRKLSHELRTPLAIIHSSLDNLGNQPLDEASQRYQDRAKHGALRLGKILTAMSEASRVEASIEQADSESVDMVDFLSALTRAYQDVYSDHRIQLQLNSGNEADNTLIVVPDLLAQMLDKLVDNAASFCPSGGSITLAYQATASLIKLSVDNDGPLLPAKMRNQLFDNLVSLRDNDPQAAHLGLGLHIVKLIVQSHRGSIRADNRDDLGGVIFTVTLPR